MQLLGRIEADVRLGKTLNPPVCSFLSKGLGTVGTNEGLV